MSEPTQICRKCKQEFPLTTEFYPRNKATKTGFDSMCKSDWRLRSKERSKSKSPGKQRQAEAVDGVKVRARKKAYDQIGPRATERISHKAELAPDDLPVQSLARLADLPKDAVQFDEFEGTLQSALKRFRERFGHDPVAVYVPARFFLQIAKAPPIVPSPQPSGRKGQKVK